MELSEETVSSGTGSKAVAPLVISRLVLMFVVAAILERVCNPSMKIKEEKTTESRRTQAVTVVTQDLEGS